MLRLTVLGLLAFAVSLSSSTVILENGMPLMWARTMGSMAELPSQGDISTPDPFDYLHRLSFSRLMIEATNPFMLTMGPDTTDSPMWALSLQLVWMHTSGRLAAPTDLTSGGKASGDNTSVAPESLWGCVNYFVSALPFLSAAQQGFMGEGAQVKLMVPDDATDYCSTHAECSAQFPDAMSKWDAYFQGLISIPSSALPDDGKKDAILGLFWDAQMASIQSSSICNGRRIHYSSKEVYFLTSWLSIFDYLSAVYFQSNLADASKFISPLPPRILEEGDNAPKIPDMSEEENHSLYIFSWMNSINDLLGGSVVSMWKRSVCSAELRAQGRDMITQLFLNPKFPTSTFVSVVSGMALSC